MYNTKGNSCRQALMTLASTTILSVSAILVLPTPGLNADVHAATQSVINYSIPEMPLRDALLAFSKQSNIQVIIATDTVDGHTAPAIMGPMTAPQALDALLKGQGLEYVFTGTGTVTIRVKEGTPEKSPAPTSERSEAPDNNIVTGLAVEEVIVTAQKRSESMQSVPISITAFTNESMKRLGFQSATDIAAMAPNVNLKKSYGTTNANIFIRGVGDSSFHLNQVGAVGIYQDEVTLNSAAVNMFQVFDLERIEVLRGPQNTLYGRNTTGGAINFISRKPDPDAGYNGDISLTYGRFNEADVDGALGVPVTDNSALRVSMSLARRDGWVHNRTLGYNENKEERYAGRIQYLVRPSDSVEILLNVHGGANRGDNARFKAIGQLDPETGDQCPTAQANHVGGGCGDIFGFVDTNNFRESFANIPNPRERLDAYGASANISWKLENVTITSLSAYEGNKLKRNEDDDAGPNSIFEFYQQQKQSQYSEELRAASENSGQFQWIVGGYFFKEDLTASTSTALRFAGAGGSTQLDQNNKVWSVYGQGSYDITDQLKFTLGARYSVEKKDGDVDAYRYDPTSVAPGDYIGRDQVVPNAFVTLPPILVNKTWKDWGGKVGLDYKINPDALLYASISRGFKGGGINIGAQQVFSGFDNFSVNPEYLVSYEVGAKTSWLDKRLRANIAFFLSKYTDQQVFQGVEGNPILTNAGKSTIKGGEFELNWSPDETWLFNAGVGYTHARFDEFMAGPELDYAGNKLLSSPELTLSGLARKQFKIGDNILGFQVDFIHLSSQEFDVSNDPRFREPARTIFNTRGSYDFGPNLQYSIELWGKNIFSKKYCSDRVDITVFGFISCTPSEPASYGATMRYRF